MKKKSERDFITRLANANAIEPRDVEYVRYLYTRHPVDWVEKLMDSRLFLSDTFFKEYAKHLKLPHVTHKQLMESAINARMLPFSLLMKHVAFPVKIEGKTITIALANPKDKENAKEISKKLGKNMDVRYAVASPMDIVEAIEKSYSGIHHLKAINELYYRFPEDSARRVLTSNQKIMFLIMAFVSLVWFWMDYPASFIFFFAFVNIAYLILNPTKFLSLLFWRKSSKTSIKITKDDVKALKRSELPVYSILLPLYKEGKLLEGLIQNMKGIEYPANKKDIMLIFEEDDEETITKAKQLGILSGNGKISPHAPEGFRAVIVPSADIKTKPRACNYALHRARGDYAVIYDAEDKPDPDQLLKAVAAFKKCEDDVVCIQAMLNYFNDRENILTMWFSVEYKAWFEYYLPGLESIGAPIPLGGTSNHFKAKYLKSLGSWDPYNVTEDADLGLRIYRTEYKTRIMESRTFEEANSRIWNWIRQRSRWQKGYIQTYLVHMRHPLKKLKNLGLKKFLLFQLTFGSNAILPLVNPILWIISIVGIFGIGGGFPFLYSRYVGLIALANLLIGNIMYILFHILAILRSGQRHLILAALFIPLYWVLISFAAWKGIVQLYTDPFYWEKTIHGITKVKMQ